MGAGDGDSVIDEGTAPAGADPGETESGPVNDDRTAASPLEVIPQILWLLTQSPQHKYMFLADMEWYFLPPFQLQQFRVFRKDGQPIGYACWAFVSDEVNERLSNGMIRLRPDEWRSGETVWLIDLVAPLGGGEMLLKKLKEEAFKGRPVKTIIPDETGKPKLVEL